MNKQQKVFDYISNNMTKDQIDTYRSLSALSSIVYEGAKNEEELVDCMFMRFKELAEKSPIAGEISKEEITSQLHRDGLINYLIEHKFIKETKGIYSVTGAGLVIGWQTYLLFMYGKPFPFEKVTALLAVLIHSLFRKKLKPKDLYKSDELKQIKEAFVAMVEQPSTLH